MEPVVQNIPRFSQPLSGDTQALNHSQSEQADHGQNSGTRKRLLLEILDALTELSNSHAEGQDIGNKTSTADAYEKLPTADKRRVTGANAFYTFRKHVKDLDQELQRLCQSFSQFGSAGIISSTVQLRTRLAKVLFIFNLNAVMLFSPNVTNEYPPDNIIAWKLKPEAEELEQLAEDFITFLKFLHDFPDLTHEPLLTSAIQFTSALKHWAVSLRDFKGRVRDPVVASYMHELCQEMNDHLSRITRSIHGFVEAVVPDIRVAQHQAATTLVSMSGLSTFVSAVTATGIQMSFNMAEGTLTTAVNAFWFSSLVFSLASAVNALLGFAWTQSRYRSPLEGVPWWVSIWIRRSPFVFLLAALVAFSVGLVMFTWASSQHIVTCLLTTAFTGVSLFSLFVVSIWFAFERSIFIRYRGERLLADVIADRYARWKERILWRTLYAAGFWLKRQSGRARCGSMTFPRMNWRDWCLPAAWRNQHSYDDDMLPSLNPSVSSTAIPLTQSLNSSSPRLPRLLPRETGSSAARPFRAERSAIRSRNASQPEFDPTDELLPKNVDLSVANTNISSMSSLTQLRVMDMFPTYRGAVLRLQFSPDGKWLATTGRDQRSDTLVIFKLRITDPFTPYSTVSYPSAFRQLAWAHDGRTLLIRLELSIKVWTEHSGHVKSIDRPRVVQTVAWLPNGRTFLSVEKLHDGNEINELDLEGNVLSSQHLPMVSLHGAVLTPDAQYMLAVATPLASPDDRPLHQAQGVTCILVYSMATKIIESQVWSPHLWDTIEISRDGQFVLASGGQKSTQLWCLEKVNGVVTLSLHRTYTDGVEVGSASPRFFGGTDDRFVLRAGPYGHVHIWDRESATHLHDIRDPDGTLSCAAWNPTSESPMLATGSSKGNVSLWAVL